MSFRSFADLVFNTWYSCSIEFCPQGLQKWCFGISPCKTSWTFWKNTSHPEESGLALQPQPSSATQHRSDFDPQTLRVTSSVPEMPLSLSNEPMVKKIQSQIDSESDRSTAQVWRSHHHGHVLFHLHHHTGHQHLRPGLGTNHWDDGGAHGHDTHVGCGTLPTTHLGGHRKKTEVVIELNPFINLVMLFWICWKKNHVNSIHNNKTQLFGDVPHLWVLICRHVGFLKNSPSTWQERLNAPYTQWVWTSVPF